MPTSPSSSARTGKDKSRCRRSGKKFPASDCVPCSQPLPRRSAGANRNLGLNNMIARAQRIGFRIEQHHDALALVIVHQEEPENRDERRNQHYRDTNQAPAQARQEQDKQAREGDEDRGTQVRLCRNQQRWQEKSAPGR